jgi:hypothetical protein
MNIGARQKSTWNVATDRLTSRHGIDPRRIANSPERIARRGRQCTGNEPGQTANRIAEFGPQRSNAHRNCDALTTTNAQDEDGRCRSNFAATRIDAANSAVMANEQTSGLPQIDRHKPAVASAPTVRARTDRWFGNAHRVSRKVGIGVNRRGIQPPQTGAGDSKP